MNDFERFSQYWNEAVNGLVYGIRSAPAALLTKEKVQELWRTELLEKRFMSTGVLHGARLFLDELAVNEPEKAAKLSRMLADSAMPCGLDKGGLVLSATGAGATALASAAVRNKAVKTSLMVLSAMLAAGAAAKGVNDGGKASLTEAVEAEAAKQLLEYRSLLCS